MAPSRFEPLASPATPERNRRRVARASPAHPETPEMGSRVASSVPARILRRCARVSGAQWARGSLRRLRAAFRELVQTVRELRDPKRFAHEGVGRARLDAGF